MIAPDAPRLEPPGTAGGDRVAPESAALAHDLLRALPEPTLLVWTDGQIVAGNAAAATLFGTAAGTLPATPLAAYLEDEPAAVARYLGACARTRSPLPGALRLRAGAARPGDGQRLRCECAVVWPAADGRPGMVLLRFRTSEEASSRFLLLNRQLQELTHEIRLRRAAEEGQRRANELLQDQTLELEVANQQLQDQAMELEQQVDAARQLADELTRANAELTAAMAAADAARVAAETANRAKADFLATMSHELRTPLNAIAGYVDLLELGVRGPVTPAQRDDLARIRRSQRHLLTLITDVLSFARLEVGHVQYRLEPVAVAPLLQELAEHLAAPIAAKALRYACEAHPEAHATADRERTRQVLLNLLTNAVKFTPAGGAIRLTCEVDERDVHVRVHDTGIGIADADLDRVFEPFVQIDQSLTRTHEGVGLGLAISRDLARGMGGDLTAASAPGQGSTFTLTLPRAR